jgi:hypothetical protein
MYPPLKLPNSQQFGSLARALNAPTSQIATLGGWGPQKIERFEKTVTEPFIIKTGSGGAIGMGRQLKGGRWMVDQEGAEVLEEEETYRNAGTAPVVRPAQRIPVVDERMPDEWNRKRNQGSEVVGFIGQNPIVRPAEAVEGAVDGSEQGSVSGTNSGVMAALARLRQQEQD